MSASGLEERIHQLLDAHRHELAAIVDQALEQELARLVEERIAIRNGNGAAPPRVCVSCGEEKPAAGFEKHRRTCRACRRRAVHERAARRVETEAAAAEPEPRPAAIEPAELARRVRRNRFTATDLEPWLVEHGFAVRVDGGLAPTVLCVEVGGGLG